MTSKGCAGGGDGRAGPGLGACMHACSACMHVTAPSPPPLNSPLLHLFSPLYSPLRSLSKSVPLFCSCSSSSRRQQQWQGVMIMNGGEKTCACGGGVLVCAVRLVMWMCVAICVPICFLPYVWREGERERGGKREGRKKKQAPSPFAGPRDGRERTKRSEGNINKTKKKKRKGQRQEEEALSHAIPAVALSFFPSICGPRASLAPSSTLHNTQSQRRQAPPPPLQLPSARAPTPPCSRAPPFRAGRRGWSGDTATRGQGQGGRPARGDRCARSSTPCFKAQPRGGATDASGGHEGKGHVRHLQLPGGQPPHRPRSFLGREEGRGTAATGGGEAQQQHRQGTPPSFPSRVAAGPPDLLPSSKGPAWWGWCVVRPPGPAWPCSTRPSSWARKVSVDAPASPRPCVAAGSFIGRGRVCRRASPRPWPCSRVGRSKEGGASEGPLAESSKPARPRSPAGAYACSASTAPPSQPPPRLTWLAGCGPSQGCLSPGLAPRAKQGGPAPRRRACIGGSVVP